MSDILVFIVTVIIAIRTFGYGIWTVSEKNILGGMFVFILSAILVALSTYLLILDRT